jgi:hypothetical protein
VATITDAEWNELTPSNFETAALLCAGDAVDEMRGDLNDGDDGRPPQLRTDLLKLHRLAMNSLEQVQDTLSQLTALYPKSLAYAGLDDAEVD